jgi:hypothetical protein
MPSDTKRPSLLTRLAETAALCACAWYPSVASIELSAQIRAERAARAARRD